MNSDNLHVNLSRNEEGSLGFSLLGKVVGIPHVIYEVIEDSPAAIEVSRKLHKKIKFHRLLFFLLHLVNEQINRLMTI